MAVDITVFEHTDPERQVPSGIDTIIHDLVKYGDGLQFAIVGVTSSDSSRDLGKWVHIEFAGRTVWFLPVARIDRISEKRSRGLPLPHSVRFCIGLARYSRRVPRGAFHTHRVETGWVAQLLKLGGGVQFIHNDSNGLLGANSDSIWKKLPKLYSRLEKSAVEHANHVVLFNASDSGRLREIRSDLITARTWFDPSVFFPNKERPASAEIRVCWVGRLESQKDPILAAETLVSLSAFATVRAQIIGQGSLLEAARQVGGAIHGPSSIDFVGAQDRIQVASTMRNSDVLLMTSHYEGSPTVVAEANACGIPVIGTTGSDPDLVLITTSNGERVDSREPKQLAQALLTAKNYRQAECVQASNLRSAPISVGALLDQIGPQRHDPTSMVR